MKMKLASIALLGAALSGVAHAGLDCDPRFYIGGEIATNKINSKKEINSNQGPIVRDNGDPIFRKNNTSASLIVGSKLNDCVGVEAGLTGMRTMEETYTTTFLGMPITNEKVTLKMRNIYADVLGYLPVTEQFDLIGSLGIGFLSSKVTGEDKVLNVVTSTFAAKSTKAGGRIGAGVGFNFTENVNARLMLRHQQGNKHVKSVNSAGLGLFYQF